MVVWPEGLIGEEDDLEAGSGWSYKAWGRVSWQFESLEHRCCTLFFAYSRYVVVVVWPEGLIGEEDEWEELDQLEGLGQCRVVD
jgi:hypothetical protein